LAGTIDHFAGTYDPQDNPGPLIEIGAGVGRRRRRGRSGAPGFIYPAYT